MSGGGAHRFALNSIVDGKRSDVVVAAAAGGLVRWTIRRHKRALLSRSFRRRGLRARNPATGGELMFVLC